jgi:ABC-type Fe3+-siderophore transport system permease subunit
MSDEGRGGGGLGAAFVILIFVGVIVRFFWWILAGIAGVALIVLVFYLVNRSDKRRAAELKQVAVLAARADEQHAQVLAGDDRGLYGEYPPAVR